MYDQYGGCRCGLGGRLFFLAVVGRSAGGERGCRAGGPGAVDSGIRTADGDRRHGSPVGRRGDAGGRGGVAGAGRVGPGGPGKADGGPQTDRSGVVAVGCAAVSSRGGISASGRGAPAGRRRFRRSLAGADCLRNGAPGGTGWRTARPGSFRASVLAARCISTQWTTSRTHRASTGDRQRGVGAVEGSLGSLPGYSLSGSGPTPGQPPGGHPARPGSSRAGERCIRRVVGGG